MGGTHGKEKHGADYGSSRTEKSKKKSKHFGLKKEKGDLSNSGADARSKDEYV
jgi:hypothetical protein